MQPREAELARAVPEGGGASRKLRFDEKDLEALFGNDSPTAAPGTAV